MSTERSASPLEPVARRAIPLLALLLLCVLALGAVGCSTSSEPTTRSGEGTAPAGVTAPGISPDDAVFAQAFEEKAEGLAVEGTGTVDRLLGDDNEGSRHQRFIVRLGSGQTLLIAHNIDIAPRVEELQVGDTVSFKGEYEWNDQGGVVHWTHHDPSGGHPAGWIEHEGRKYR